MDLLNSFFIRCFAIHRLRIRKHMHEKKEPERNYSRQLVELSQKKGVTEFYGHRLAFTTFIGFREILEPKSQFYNFACIETSLFVSTNKIK